MQKIKREMKITLANLRKITEISNNILNNYLGNYRFSKYECSDVKRKRAYVVNDEFLKEFAEFTEMRSNNPKTLKSVKLGIMKLESLLKGIA